MRMLRAGALYGGHMRMLRADALYEGHMRMLRADAHGGCNITITTDDLRIVRPPSASAYSVRPLGRRGLTGAEPP